MVSAMLMDAATVQRGLTSLRWFLAAHAEELTADLLWALGEGGNEIRHQNINDLVQRVYELDRNRVEQLCSAIQSVHRSYFGTMNGRELSLFLHRLVDKDSRRWFDESRESA
jgi:hypothetical protein